MGDLPLTEAYLSSRPAAAAHHLEGEPAADVAALLMTMDADVAAPVIAAMVPTAGASVLASAETPAAARIIEAIDVVAAARMLRAWPEPADAVLDALDRRRASALRAVMAYDPRSVGAYTDSSAPAFDPTVSAGDALARLRRLPRVPELAAVVAEDGVLTGTVTVRDLLAAPEATPLGRLARASSAPLLDVQRLSSAADHECWNEGVTAPVVDPQRRFVGMLIRRAVVEDQRPAVVTAAPGVQLWTHVLRAFIHCVVGVGAAVSSARDPRAAP